MVLGILLIVYRSPVTMLLPLITIGIELVTAQGIVSGLAQLGLGISSQAIAFMTALVAGAGTDYAVFLDQPVSRLLASRCGVGSSRVEGVDVRRQGDRRLRWHRRRDLPGDGFHASWDCSRPSVRLWRFR